VRTQTRPKVLLGFRFRFKDPNWTKSTLRFRFTDVYKPDLNQKSKSRECKHEVSKGIQMYEKRCS